MCGIVGFLDLGCGDRRLEPEQVLQRMADAVAHRGPDDAGLWLDLERGVGLGHRRLSIVDLSPAGHQPMQSQCGRYVIVFNGEVFSFVEMRDELRSQGVSFTGGSDTEVILEGFSRWGLDATLAKMIGMFAIALWDRAECTLTLIRDRVGIKPLYWREGGGLALFGSELKALRAHPGWTPELDRDALAAFMRHNYIPAPFTIYRGVHKLEAGTYVVLGRNRPTRCVRYWDLREVVRTGAAGRDGGASAASVDQLESLLKDAVKRRMIADVPLGALLSGGIDSSLVTALMQAQSDRPVRTFSIGFDESGYDEAPYARAIAQHLGTDHTELYVEPGHALQVIPRLAHWWDEPFADSSQIPTYLVCELTRRHVTVVLSGDGGDEVFCGYTRYVLGSQLSTWTRRIPSSLRHGAAAALRQVAPLMPSTIGLAPLERRLGRLADVLLEDEPDVVYRQMLSQWSAPDAMVPGAREAKGRLWDEDASRVVPNFIERMQYLDTLTYLPDDILTKVDRASMAVALEARVPLLDHRVIEAAWRMPLALKMQGGDTKIVLRRILNRYVPAAMFDRPKMGFGVPIDRWLRGPLRDWAGNLLDPDRLRRQGLIDPKPVQERWQAHLAGANWAYPLWTVLMLQAWIDENPSVSLG